MGSSKAPLFFAHILFKMRISIAAIFTLFIVSTYAQRFEEFYAIPKSRFEETLKNKKKICDFSLGEWINAPVQKMDTEHYGKFTIVHFTSFDNFMSNTNVQDLIKFQQEFPQARVILSLNPKFNYPKSERDILFELEKRQIPLPIYIDKEFEFWQCMGAEFWPTTMFFGPKGALLETHEGRLNINEIRRFVPEVLNRLRNEMDEDTEQFIAMTPGRWNKRTILEYPSGLAVSEKESMLFVSDQLGDRILGLTLAGNVIFCVGDGEKGNKDGSLEESRFNGPRGMVMDEENLILYVADTDNHTIRKVDLVNDQVTTILGNGSRGTKKTKKVVGQTGPLNEPSDVLLDGDYLYISMQGLNQIWKMDLRTEVAVPIAGSTEFGFTKDSPRKSHLAAPSGLALDISGAIFFTEAQASSLRYVSDEDLLKISAGTGVFEFGHSDGKKDNIKMRFPNGITAHDEKIYVADTYNNCIRIIDPFKRKSETLTGNPSLAGYRNGSEPLFNQPMDVEVIGDQIIIADAANGAIRSYDLSSGVVKSIALGNHGCLGRGKGKGGVDLRDGASLSLGNGLNELTYSIDLGEDYELDPTAFQSVNLNTRAPGFEFTDYDFNDGSVSLFYMPDSSKNRLVFTLEFTLFIRSIQEPHLQYRKDISFFHQFNLSDEAGLIHQVTTRYDPDVGRE